MEESVELTGFRKHLFDEGLLSQAVIDEVWAHSLKHDRSFIKCLLEKKKIDSKKIAKMASDFFKIPFFDIDTHKIDAKLDVSKYENFLKTTNDVLPISERGDKLYVAVYDPNVRALDEIKFHSGKEIVPLIVEFDKLQKMIGDVFHKDAASIFEELSSESLEDIELDFEVDEVQGVEDIDIEDAPLVRFVHTALLDAIKVGASDIHFEPYEKYYRIRQRRDGILHEVMCMSAKMANRVTARLKVLSRLDVSERRLPQDGRFKVNLSEQHSIDFRVSTCPISHGEKVVVRILDPTSVDLGIEQLGLREEQSAAFHKVIQQSQGMILVTGPTGSGKTVTLYSALQLLNTVEKNISTIEDPVEIKIQGINQVQINPKAGLTFASALRSFLRQDPDVIMVGEIRDLETAEIGIRAAETGHLVLSTLHTNSATATLERLIDMGLTPFNIASSISIIIAQRLVRCLCNHCKQPVEIPDQALLEEGFSQEDLKDLTVYAAVGCDQCLKGYRGRVGIFEVMPVTDRIAHAIMSAVSSIDLLKVALDEGMLTLRMSGLEKVKAGLTSLEEVNRITIA